MNKSIHDVRTYHIQDLYEVYAELNGDSLRIIGDRSHQSMITLHHVIVQPALEWPLMRN